MTQGFSLPNGWKWVKINEIAELSGGGTPSRENPDFFTGDIVWLTPTEIPKDRISIVSSSKEMITQQALKKSSARLLPKGTVLMTSRASIGYVAIAGTEVTTNQGFASFSCKSSIYNYYLAYWLYGNADFFKQEATGTTFKEIAKSKLKNFSLPLPPLPEQERIVAKIEELFTQLDAGTAALRRVQAALKRYKASVLKAACEGRLVAQDPSDEPAEELLNRLGKIPFKENNRNLLPANWSWAKLADITAKIMDVDHKMPKPVSLGIPYVSTKDFVGENEIGYENAKQISEQDYTALCRKIRPQSGDILLSRYGTIGQVRRVKTKINFQASYSIAIIKTLPIDVLNEYLVIFLRSETGQTQMRKNIRASSQPDLGLEYIRRFSVPLPPFEEQKRIVSEVEKRLSLAAEVEGAVKAALVRTSRLRQSILSRAFEGKLVLQDPQDTTVGPEVTETLRGIDAIAKQARLFS